MHIGDKTVLVQTLGCKLNFAETSAMTAILEQAGYRRIRSGKADVCLINTCSVTAAADQKDRQAIHKIIREHPEAFVAVTGCYAQLKPSEVADIQGVDLVLGADFKLDLLSHIHENKNAVAEVLTSSDNEITHFLPACAKGDRTRFFLKVQDGCDFFCTYCTVPFARGRSRNPSISSLVEQATAAINQGAREIVLSGVNIGTFGKRTMGQPASSPQTLLQLLEALDEIPGCQRFRISSLEPDLLTDDIINFVATSEHFMPHFHLPLQSGDDEMLDLMHRHYHSDLFEGAVHRIKETMPDAFIGVDVIVGMRGETPERFHRSMSFLQRLDISQLHVFSYSERPGTQALKIPYIVSPAEKKARSELLHKLSEEKRIAFYTSQTGRQLKVLFEHGNKGGLMSGFTENYIRVEAPWRRDWENTIQLVVPSSFNKDKSALTLNNSTD